MKTPFSNLLGVVQTVLKTKPFVLRILTFKNIKDDYAKSEMIKRNSKITADFLLFLILQRSVDEKY